MRLNTRLIHHPGAECEHTGAVSPPIYQAGTFRQESATERQEYDYSRAGNPTREVLEDYIAELEGGVGGVAFGPGMAAISSCLMLLEAGDHLVATEGLYGGTYRVLRRIFSGLDIECTFADTTRRPFSHGSVRKCNLSLFSIRRKQCLQTECSVKPMKRT